MGNWCELAPDSFAYLATARTLIESGHYPPGQMMRPPGFPTLIAPLLLLGDLPLQTMRILLGGCLAAASVMTFLLHRRELGQGLGWLTGLLVAINSVLFMQTTVALSEPLYIVLSLGVLLVLQRWWREPMPSRGHIALGGLLVATTVLVRSMGIVLLPLLVVALARQQHGRRRQRLAGIGLLLVCGLGPVLAWQARERANPAGPGYAGMWTTARTAERTDATGAALQIERLARFGPKRLESVKEALLPKALAWRAFNPPLDVPTTWLVGGILVSIAVVRVIRYRTCIDAYLLLTMGMLVLWPWDEGVRLISPLIPILVAYPVWLALIWWRRRGVRGWERVGLAAAFMFAMAIQLWGMGIVQSRLPARREKAAFRLASMAALARWHESNTPQGAPWLGVTPDGDNSKLVLLGAAYLSRRPLAAIDLHPGMDLDLAAADLSPSSPSCVLLHRSLLDGRQKLARRGYGPSGSIDEFVFFMRTDE